MHLGPRTTFSLEQLLELSQELDFTPADLNHDLQTELPFAGASECWPEITLLPYSTPAAAIDVSSVELQYADASLGNWYDEQECDDDAVSSSATAALSPATEPDLMQSFENYFNTGEIGTQHQDDAMSSPAAAAVLSATTDPDLAAIFDLYLQCEVNVQNSTYNLGDCSVDKEGDDDNAVNFDPEREPASPGSKRGSDLSNTSTKRNRTNR